MSLLTHKYEVFKMEKNETINDMFNQFNANIVGLEGLGKTIGKAGAQPQAITHDLCSEGLKTHFLFRSNRIKIRRETRKTILGFCCSTTTLSTGAVVPKIIKTRA